MHPITLSCSSNYLKPTEQIELIEPIDFATANSREIYLAYTQPLRKLCVEYASLISILQNDEVDPQSYVRVNELYDKGRSVSYEICEAMSLHYSGWEKVNAFVYSIFGGPQMIEQLPEIDYKAFSLAEQSGLSKLHENMTYHVMKSYNLQNQLFFVIKQKYISGSSDSWPTNEEGEIIDFVSQNTYDTKIIVVRSDEIGWKVEYHGPNSDFDKSIHFIDVNHGIVGNSNWHWCNPETYVNNELDMIKNRVQYHISMTIMNNYLPKEISHLTLNYIHNVLV